jgi:long-chain acyl-CoA synthetase
MFNLNSYSERTACILSDGRKFSYADLNYFSNSLKSSVEPHTLVFHLCENNFESLVGYVSFVNNNNVVLMLDAHMEQTVFQTLYNLYKPQYIWSQCTSLFKDEFEIVNEINDYKLYKTSYLLAELLPENLSVLLTTSGSTGSPKLVRLSKKNLLSNAQSIIEYLKITEDERPVTGLPMFYSYGLSVINSHLLVGATLLLTSYSYIQREFWLFANNFGFTSFSGIPYTYEVLKKLKFWTMNCPTLKTLTQAGGKLSNELLKYFIKESESKGVKFYLMYGQTEATARMSYLPPEYGLKKLGSIGKGIPDGTLYIVDENGLMVSESNVVGELVYRGDNVCLGYADSLEDLYKADENNGVLYTGDLAYRDEDGFYFISGRKKRFLKIFGNRISLDYLETLLKSHLKECVCVGNDNKLVIYTTDKIYDENLIIDFLVARTKILRTVFSVKYIDTIPRSDTGKILYKQLLID